jgi:cell division septation protein DedD
VQDKAVPAAKTVPLAKTPVPAVAAAPAEAKREVASSPATHQPFTLSVGTFVNQKNQRAVEKTIRRLGYTPQVKSTFIMVPMTRLRLGVYDPATAAARRRELSAQLPGLFAMKRGNKVTLYAGSFQSLDQARSFADRLYLRGIHVDEETTSLRMPVKKISYGAFTSRAAAEKAVKRAAKAGLTVEVVKR